MIFEMIKMQFTFNIDIDATAASEMVSLLPSDRAVKDR